MMAENMPSLTYTDEDDNLLFQSDEESDSDADIETGKFGWSETIYKTLNRGKGDKNLNGWIDISHLSGNWDTTL